MAGRMKFLVDSNVLSEPTKDPAAASVVEWLSVNESELAVNPIVLGELEFGILKLPSGRRKTQLRQWFAQAPKRLRVLDIDANTSQIWATLMAGLSRKGRSMPVSDSLIAATALQYGLAVATRNISDYMYSGVEVLNPFRL